MTLHADEEMDADDLVIFDIEHGILHGSIVERQSDTERGDWKYLVKGPAIDGASITAVTRLHPPGRLVIITVFRENGE